MLTGIQAARELRFDDVLYIDYRNHVVTYHLISGELISTPTLRIGFTEYLEKNHGEGGFVRCHESIAVNIGAIDKLTKQEISLRGGEIIPVSKSRYTEVANQYMDYRF
ncbi:LytTr DNA-binding domain-containing protein [Lachnospiraceae bacterium XBB1006]|nr:LytTr DNA-binding domain-containing protein [Lachnospiraceae bacterium XBB1006]